LCSATAFNSKILVEHFVKFYFTLPEKTTAYHLKMCHVPLVVGVPQVENHIFK